MNYQQQLKISEQSMEYGAQFAKAWKGWDVDELKRAFDLYVKERRKLPKDENGKRIESYMAYLSTQGGFKG